MKFSVSGVIKCILYIVNVLWVIGGLALIVLAFLGLKTESAAFICFEIIGGIVMSIVGVLGCWGIRKQDVRLTTTYAIMIALFLVAQVVVLVCSYSLCTSGKSVDKDVENTWMAELLIPGAMDDIQQKHHCCGYDSPDDYYSIDRDFPLSCYPNMILDKNALWKSGCAKAGGKGFNAYCPPSKNWKSFCSTAVMLMLAIYLVKHFRDKEGGLSQA